MLDENIVKKSTLTAFEDHSSVFLRLCAVSQQFDKAQRSSERLVVLIVIWIVHCQRSRSEPEAGK